MKYLLVMALFVCSCAAPIANLGGQQEPPPQMAPMPQLAPMPMPARSINCATTCYGGTCYTRC